MAELVEAGGYDLSGSDIPANIRGNDPTASGYDNFGFRPALFL